jgi:hypothetical protein
MQINIILNCMPILLILVSSQSPDHYNSVAILAAIAYEPPENIKAWNCTLCNITDRARMQTVITRQGLQAYMFFYSKN